LLGFAALTASLQLRTAFVAEHPMTTRLLHTIRIAADIHAVFDYVSTPAFWPDWHPSSLRLFGDVARCLGAGDHFEEDVRAGGRTARLHWQVVAAEAPRVWTATAVADNGVELELDYRMQSDAQGVMFERELQYQVPGWWLKLLNRLVLRRRIDAESAHSLRQLKSVLEQSKDMPASNH
jgi:hypothetical protein